MTNAEIIDWKARALAAEECLEDLQMSWRHAMQEFDIRNDENKRLTDALAKARHVIERHHLGEFAGIIDIIDGVLGRLHNHAGNADQ